MNISVYDMYVTPQIIQFESAMMLNTRQLFILDNKCHRYIEGYDHHASTSLSRKNYYRSGIDVSATVEASLDCFYIPCLSCLHHFVALQALQVIDHCTHEVMR